MGGGVHAQSMRGCSAKAGLWVQAPAARSGTSAFQSYTETDSGAGRICLSHKLHRVPWEAGARQRTANQSQ